MSDTYKFVDALNIKRIDTPQDGKGYAETWSAGEEGTPETPRPVELPIDQNGVQVFRPDAYDENMHAGEALHLDPVANKYRAAILETLIPDQIDLLKQVPDYRVGNGNEQQRLQSAVDSAIRGAVVGQWPKSEVDSFFSPEQRAALDELLQYMHSGDPAGDRALNSLQERSAMKRAYDEMRGKK